MVISELFGANHGLGATVVQFQRSFAIPQMWTGIIVLGLLGSRCRRPSASSNTSPRLVPGSARRRPWSLTRVRHRCPRATLPRPQPSRAGWRTAVRRSVALDVRGLRKTYEGTGAGSRRSGISPSPWTAASSSAWSGPSGAGKTTLLRCVAGLLDPTEGDILLEGTR
jgi:ABC-type glutathione transport system ATPase component